MIIATMSCGHLDIAPSPMVLSLLESLDAETAVAHAGGDDTYSTYYQAGAVTHEIIAAAQVDVRARVNNIRLRKKDGGLVRLPGQGGMADVFRCALVTARGALVGKSQYALKILREPEDVEQRQRFQREGVLLARLRHRNLIPILAVDVDAEPPFYVMPVMKETLADHFERMVRRACGAPQFWSS